MKVKVKDIYNLKNGLDTLNEKEYPIATALKLQRISLKVNEEYEIASNLRLKLVEKYKEKTLDNGNVQLKKDKIPVFNEEMKELLEQDVEITLDKIELSALGETIKPSTLILVDKIIKEGE